MFKKLISYVLVLGLVLCAASNGFAFSASGGSITGTTITPSQGGFGTPQTFPSAGFFTNTNCQQSGSNAGPAGINQLYWTVIYQPIPFSFSNGEITYNPGVADASVESDLCIYQYNSGALNLAADTGIIAIASAGNPNPSPVLGGGTSLLTSQPTASTCGSGSVTNCVGGVFPPGFYAIGIASAATTAKLKTCGNTAAIVPSFAHGGTTATGGQCPLTISSVTLTSPNAGTATVIMGPQ